MSEETNQLLVLAVPAGAVPRDGTTAPLRALIVPQLRMATGPAPTAGDPDDDDGKPLSEFGFDRWPDVINAAAFTATLGTGAGLTTLQRRSTASPDAWQGVFKKDIRVYQPRRTAHDAPVVNPTVRHASTLTGSYTDVTAKYGETGVDPVAAAALVDKQYAAWTAPPDVVVAAPRARATREERTQPRKDFQRTLAMLRAHPAVLIQLGLIVEFEVAATELPTAGTIRFEASFDATLPSGITVVTPVTGFTFSRKRFLPQSGPDSDVVNGVVDLEHAKQVEGPPSGQDTPGPLPKWSLVTFDVDGAVDRMRDGAQKMMDDPQTGSDAILPRFAAPVTLPVLQTAGIALLRNDRGAVMQNRIAKNGGQDTTAARQQVAGRELGAEDLTAGYCIDIRASTSDDWTPVCERTATYTYPAAGVPQTIVECDEEAPVAIHAAALVDGDKTRTDEVVARWNGWNLAIPRPMFDQRGLRPRDSTRNTDALPIDFDYAFAQTARRQIQLRFGKGYYMRVRAVDMAGGGLTVEQPDANEGSSDVVLYRRHEPVGAPEFAPLTGVHVPDPDHPGELKPDPDALGAGGSVDRLVIRSDPAGDTPMSVDEYRAAFPHYPANDTRSLLPPPVSMTLAEQHGMLDGSGPDTWLLAQRAMSAPAAAEDGSYNWLPDPASIGIQAYVRPGADSPAPAQSRPRTWTPEWPHVSPKLLKLQQPDPSETVIDWVPASGPRGEDALVVRLDAGLQADLELSSTLDSEKLDHLQVRSWTTGVDALLTAGRHPMVTPPRIVELIHAVRRPIDAPSVELTVTRNEGETFAVLTDAARPLFGVHRPSTGQIVVHAQWGEPVDDEEPGETVDALVGTLTVGRDAEKLADLRHEFGDTKHRIVAYRFSALSRYRSFFDEGENADFRHDMDESIIIDVPSSATPPPPVVLGVAPAFRWTVEPGGMVRHRLGRMVRVELARPWNVSGADELLAVLIAPDGTPEPDPEGPDPQLSRAYRDPIWRTTQPAGLLRHADFEERPPGVHVTDVPPGQPWASPFGASLDAHGDRWFADVEIPMATTSYSPFVRLAVARYQPQSIAGCAMSSPVMTDFVQMLPDRTLRATLNGTSLTLVLEGIGPDGPRPNKVIAVVERCTLPGLAADTPSDVTSARSDQAGLWFRDGQVAVGGLNAPIGPLDVSRTTGLVRVVVREIEDIPSPVPAADPATFAADLQQRTVFLDVVPIA